jgi:hypothetical protein
MHCPAVEIHGKDCVAKPLVILNGITDLFILELMVPGEKPNAIVVSADNNILFTLVLYNEPGNVKKIL